jgi:hypothetical protein
MVASYECPCIFIKTNSVNFTKSLLNLTEFIAINVHGHLREVLLIGRNLDSNFVMLV